MTDLNTSTEATITDETAIGFIPCYRLPFLSLFHADCMEIMKQYPNKYFDLAIVDPPYDLSIGNKTNFYVSQGKYNKKQETRPMGGFKIGGNYMDSIQKAPNKEYFDEIQRVSKNQIIFGGNYFTDILKPTTCWIVWDKMNGENYFGDFEMAWTSFGKANRMFKKVVHEPNRIHPTQKPIALYDWIVKKMCEPNTKIIDTHFGSGSISLAVDKANRLDKMNLHLTAVEIDKEYIEKAIKRISESIKQGMLSF